jgi:hypothetical protein
MTIRCVPVVICMVRALKQQYGSHPPFFSSVSFIYFRSLLFASFFASLYFPLLFFHLRLPDPHFLLLLCPSHHPGAGHGGNGAAGQPQTVRVVLTFSKSVYLGKQRSDFNDHNRTLVLQTISSSS